MRRGRTALVQDNQHTQSVHITQNLIGRAMTLSGLEQGMQRLGH